MRQNNQEEGHRDYHLKLERALASATRQILERKLELCYHFTDLKGKRYFGKKEYENIFTRLVGYFDSITITFDALDEFSNEHSERLKLARDLNELREVVGVNRLKMLITTREMKDVEKTINPTETLPIRADPADIGSIVLSVFKDTRFAEDHTLGKDAVQEIVKRSDCM